VIAIFALVTPIVIELINRRRQRRSEKELATDSDAGSYPAPVIENATRYYVRPKCSNVDPAQEAEIRNVIATSEDLFKYVDDFLEGAPRMKIGDGPIRHLIVLADSGMGKTSFVLNYFAYNKKKRLRNRKRLAIIHLGSADALEKIIAIDNKRETDLFLDALDEDTKAVGAPDAHRTRLLEIFQACPAFRHVVITCRTQFFPRDDEIPKSTGIIDLGPRPAGQGGHYQLWKVYLNPLSDDQVREYINKRYPGILKNREKRKKAIETVLRIPLLSARPMLLSYIPDLLESNRPIDHTYQLYEVMVEKWLEREKGWVSDTGKLLEFSEAMAVDIYTRKDERGAEKISREELLKIARNKGIELEDWKLTGRSLLNRDAEGNFKFAHRSIMEYLFVKRSQARGIKRRSPPWTDFMKQFLLESLKLTHSTRSMIPAPGVRSVHIYYANWDLSYADLSETDFIKFHDKSYSSTGHASSQLRFAGVFRGVNFSNTIFHFVSFESSTLSKVNFAGCKTRFLSFLGSTLTDINLQNAAIEELELSHTRINKLDITGAKIGRLIALNTDLTTVTGLTKEHIKRAKTNDKTVIPPHLKLRKFGMTSQIIRDQAVENEMKKYHESKKEKPED
jgi:hypothetical protein